jgi:acyl-CoA dehydrogenase
LLVVETGAPGFAVTRRLAKMGWHCSDTAELGYAGVRVPVENLVGDEGAGFGQIMRQFVTERLALAGHAHAVAARALALTRAWRRDRVTFGAPLTARQAVVHRLVEMRQRVELARTFTLHGGAGYLRETEVERHYRDVRILGIGGGATEVLADLAGRLLGYTAASAR